MVESGSDLDVGTCTNSDSAREWHRNTQITHFRKTVKNGACGAQVEAQVRQKFVKSSSRVCPAAPTERQSAPKCSLGPPNWCTFRTSWTTFAHYPSRLLPACTFHSKRPFQTALIGRLSSFGCAFEATARLGWIGWVASAWLSEIIVRWAAAAMPSKSLGGRLQCFKLCFARLHWRRKAPMRI